MSKIHDRMPVILGRSDEDAWLDPEVHEQDWLQQLLMPSPTSWLTAVEVAPLVNSPKNNDAAVLQPAVENPAPARAETLLATDTVAKDQPRLFD